MSEGHRRAFDDANVADENAAREQIAALAKCVKNQRQLKKTIADARPDLREQVYELIRPHLNFKPLSFLLTKPR